MAETLQCVNQHLWGGKGVACYKSVLCAEWACVSFQWSCLTSHPLLHKAINPGPMLLVAMLQAWIRRMEKSKRPVFISTAIASPALLGNVLFGGRHLAYSKHRAHCSCRPVLEGIYRGIWHSTGQETSLESAFTLLFSLFFSYLEIKII